MPTPSCGRSGGSIHHPPPPPSAATAAATTTTSAPTTDVQQQQQQHQHFLTLGRPTFTSFFLEEKKIILSFFRLQKFSRKSLFPLVGWIAEKMYPLSIFFRPRAWRSRINSRAVRKTISKLSITATVNGGGGAQRMSILRRRRNIIFWKCIFRSPSRGRNGSRDSSVLTTLVGCCRERGGEGVFFLISARRLKLFPWGPAEEESLFIC